MTCVIDWLIFDVDRWLNQLFPCLVTFSNYWIGLVSKLLTFSKLWATTPNWNWKLNCPKLLVVVLALIKVGPLLIVFHQGMQNLCKTVNISFGLYGTRTGIEPGKWYFSKIKCFLQSLHRVKQLAAELSFYFHDIRSSNAGITFWQISSITFRKQISDWI